MEQRELKLFEERHVLSVSEVVHQVKLQLEERFHDIWVQGEISNFRAPGSGHHYFTLKDGESQLRAVCFRMQNRLLKFLPEDGMDVLARGSLSVYPPRGDFQLIVELMEPVGPGALQVAFEQLKARLAAAGLFETSRKRPLPLFPAKVGIVTSPSGAAIRDILRVLARRNDRLNILIFPSPVQGAGAARQIASGIRYFNSREDIDVILVTRGGGSLEDLWAFNEEAVAQAIYESRLPVVSAVGHEIDWTIADLVADLRAPTPSAAAEIISGAREELSQRVAHLLQRSAQAVRLDLKVRRERLARLTASRAFVDAESRLRFFLQRLDELQNRLLRTLPLQFPVLRQQCLQQQALLHKQMSFALQTRRHLFASLYNQMQAFSPLAVLKRGYAIVSDQGGRIVRSPGQVGPGDEINLRVEQGEFRARKI